MMNKKLIAQRFGAARATYEQAATVQREVATKMVALIAEHIRPRTSLKRLAEVGCGTGTYSRLLYRYLQPDLLLLNDLCPQMAASVATDNPAIQFVAGDAEQLELPKSLDLITSCSTLQWFEHPRRFFERSLSALREGGYLAISTFGPQNMQEIRALTGKGLTYFSIPELKEMLPPDFKVVHASHEVITLKFASPLDVLKHLKAMGVTGLEPCVWTRARLEAFCRDYQAHFQTPDGKCTLTYHPLYLIARRKQKSVALRVPSGSYFVTGIDTDAGKTFATGWLARQLLEQGHSVITQKPVQTGNTRYSEDLLKHRQIMGIPLTKEDKKNLTAPFRFSYPASPHLAARIDRASINFRKLQATTQKLAERYDIVLVEGAGGLMVPLSHRILTIDYIADCGYPVILVTSGKLGSINHTILSVEAMLRRGLTLFAVLYNHYPASDDDIISADTRHYLRNYLKRTTPQTRFWEVPLLQEYQ
jgi:malonyl-ACP O-methyltransferase BioC/dethiobiotin synthase